MSSTEPTFSNTSERGTHIALIFALLAEKLRVHFEHDKWLNTAQCATLAADWLSRSKRTLPQEQRKQLAELSDIIAKQILETSSREAGLFISHELQEALDPRYYSELGQTLMQECERLYDISLKQTGPDAT